MMYQTPKWEHRVLEALKGVPQDPIWHAEGDVETHVKMVRDAMVASDGFDKLTDSIQTLLYWTTLLHDIAKPICIQHEDGRVRSHGHAKRGSIMARTLLYEQGVTPMMREHICGIIRWHMAPVNTLNEEREVARWKTLRANLVAPTTHLRRHAHADMAGRITKDPEDSSSLQLEAFDELVEELGCLEQDFPWGNDQSRIEFFASGGARDPRYKAHEPKYKGEVVLMAGMPGSGKDTWIKKNLKGWTMLSLDDIREATGHSDRDQGPIIIKAKECYQDLLRKGTSFVFNATNLVYDLRRPWIGMALRYGFRVRVVYVEAPYKTIWERNKSRPEKKRLPESAIKKMLDKWELPDESEGHVVERIWDAC